MAQPTLESFDLRGVAIKEETTEGTDSIPTGADNAIVLLDGSSGTEFDKVERNIDRPFFTGTPFSIANRRAFIEGNVELFPPVSPGNATDGTPHYDILLRMAGMTKVLDDTNFTTIYNMISSGIVSASAYFWHVDTLKKVLGARANVSGLGFTVGEIPTINARVLGRYENIIKEALPSLTLPEFTPLAVESDNSETLISVPNLATPITDLLVWAKSLNVNFASELGSKEYTSKKVFSISDREPTFTLRIARTDLADFNPWDIRDANETITASLKQDLGGSGDNYAKLEVRGQIEGIDEVDIDGDLGWELTGPCVASNVGGDEIKVEFGVIA